MCSRRTPSRGRSGSIFLVAQTPRREKDRELVSREHLVRERVEVQVPIGSILAEDEPEDISSIRRTLRMISGTFAAPSIAAASGFAKVSQ